MHGHMNVEYSMLPIPYNFPQSTYFPTHALRDTIYITHTKTPTCFGIQVPSLGIYYNRSVQASLLIFVWFLVTSLIQTLFVKTHNMYKMYKIDIVDNLQCFDYTLIVSLHGRNKCVLWCLFIYQGSFIEKNPVDINPLFTLIPERSINAQAHIYYRFVTTTPLNTLQ